MPRLAPGSISVVNKDVYCLCAVIHCNCLYVRTAVCHSLSVFFSVFVVIPVIYLCGVVFKDNFELASIFIIKCRSVI